MRYDECGEYYNPRSICEWECPTCGRVWQLIYSGYDEKWTTLGMEQDDEPMIGDKCPGCVMTGLEAKHLLQYAEEKDRRAIVLRSMLSRSGAPLDENDPVIAWAWDAFKDSDAELLAEAVRDALWYERDQIAAFVKEAVA